MRHHHATAGLTVATVLQVRRPEPARLSRFARSLAELGGSEWCEPYNEAVNSLSYQQVSELNSPTSSKRSNTRKPRKGRPTAEESLELDERIKASALDHFLQHGFDAATMDNIARDAGITKRTLYARYRDKETLFQKVLSWALVQWREVNLDVEREPGTSLEEELLRVAELMLQRELNLKVVRLGRIATSQIERIQTLESPALSMEWSPRMRAVISILKHHAEQGTVVVPDFELAAELFISLVVGIPTRLAAFGVFRDLEFEQHRLREAVRIFLRGIAPPT